MDLVLLGFCLISLLITGFIVFLDISRKGTRKLDVPQENLPEFDESLPLKGMEVGETPELSDAEEDWKVESISSRDEPVEIQDKDSGKPVPEVDFSENNEEEKPKEKIKDSMDGAKKVGRNEKCPCGSGKKFKHCHGNL